MKTERILLVIIVLALVALASFGFQALDTTHKEFLLLRTEANEDTDLISLSGSEGDFANKPSSAKQLRARDDGEGHGGSGLELIFCGGDLANDTFTYKVYVWRRTNGPARMVATGEGTLGTQDVVKYPHSGSTATAKYWADTLTVTDRWIKSVGSSDTSGNNEIASLTFDMCGYEWIYVEITGAADTGTEAESVSVYYSYY